VQTTIGPGRPSYQSLEWCALLGRPEIQYRRCWWLQWFSRYYYYYWAKLHIAINVTVPWSVCLLRSFIVFKRQKTWIRFFLRSIAPCLSQIALKFSLHRSNPSSSPNVAPFWFECRRHIRWQIAADWLEIAQWSQWRAYRNHHRSFEWYHRWPPTTSPSPNRGPKCTTQWHDQLCDACCHLANMIEDINKISLHKTSDVSFCQLTLAPVGISENGFYVALYAYWTEQGICSEYSLANSCLQWMALYVVITCLSDIV